MYFIDFLTFLNRKEWPLCWKTSVVYAFQSIPNFFVQAQWNRSVSNMIFTQKSNHMSSEIIKYVNSWFSLNKPMTVSNPELTED